MSLHICTTIPKLHVVVHCEIIAHTYEKRTTVFKLVLYVLEGFLVHGTLLAFPDNFLSSRQSGVGFRNLKGQYN